MRSLAFVLALATSVGSVAACGKPTPPPPLDRQHQNATEATGPNSQYYLSKNGRVYYRDADHRAHWVTPPPGGLSVPESEAAQYRQFQGCAGNAEGRDLVGLSNE